MSKTFFLLALCTLILQACQEQRNADEIVLKAIEYAGGDRFERAHVAFNFRDKHYEIERGGEAWIMKRSFHDSSIFIEDTYSREGFKRKINGKMIEVADSMAFKYIESINSVIYFALLPYKLNDPAVIKQSLGQEEINHKNYHKIKVRFRKEGGGVDYQDEFIYWFDQQDYSLGFLAYTFHVNGGGMRFRKAYNERFIEGIRFVDYVNYQPQKSSTKLIELASEYEEDKLMKLSTVELKDVKVKLNLANESR
jgi:hypothetical protein